MKMLKLPYRDVVQQQILNQLTGSGGLNDHSFPFVAN